MGDGPPPVAVFVEPVQMVPYSPAIKLIGETKAEQRATLAAEVAGSVTGIRHRVGERHNVSDGWLVSIDPATYQAGVGSAQAAVDMARENLRKAQNGPRSEDVRAQEAQVEAAKARVSQAEDNLKRMEALAAGGVIAETALVTARTEYETAKNAHEAARQVLAAMQAGTREEDIAAAKAAVSQAESNLKNSRVSLGRTTVGPEFDAIVSNLMVEVGQYVGPGTPLVEVVSAGSTEAWFNLPEEELGNVSPGDDVEMRFTAFPDEVFHGAVISISPAANEQTRQFPLRVEIRDERILPGMTVEGRILRSEPVPTKMINMDSVIQAPLGTVCWVMDPDPNDPQKTSARQVIIETGARVDNMVVVMSDELQPGMMVVTRGKQQVYPTAMLIPVNLMNMGGGGEGGPPAGAEGGGMPPGAGAPAGDDVSEGGQSAGDAAAGGQNAGDGEAGQQAGGDDAAGGQENPCGQESNG
ncbi:MAG: efflux RND transporter periplasmic adaptor subunit [Planctomycetales bacterium]|nr:efflux RND transporter periplasmic adaptor subunit [bacterium]UNM07400.1 MAG: efflux RND transporter periplasmic adaptor subunit [Planctomycetales bacterium]